jgi:hypothetical protein
MKRPPPVLRATALSALLAVPALAAAQAEGSTEAAVLGGALGAYSGAGLGLMASLVPCDRSPAGPTCARIVTALGGASGLVAGSLLGHADEDELRRRLRSAGYGTLIGAAVGLAMQQAIRQYDWRDVLASAAVGAAVGASAVGAGLGFAAGAATGTLLWQGLGVIDASEAVALGLGGLAVGGLVGWAVSPSEGAPAEAAPFFSIAVPAPF